MGDSRFEVFLARVRGAPDRAEALRALTDEEVVQALAAASRDQKDPYLANVLATETMNRLSVKTSIVANAGQGLLAAERDGRITFANPAAERILGHASGGLRGTMFRDILRPAITSEPDAPLGAGCALDSALHHLDDKMVRKDGSLVPIDWTVSFDVREGDTRGVVIAFTDVTERKLAEATLHRERQLQELLLSAQSNLGEGVILSNAQRILHVNEACIALTGRPREELLALGGLPDLLTPEQVARLSALGPLGEARRRFDVHLVQPSGRELCVEVALKTLQLEDETATITLLRDVTTTRFVLAGLRESERAFRAAFERAPAGLAQLDADGRWLRINASAASALGHTLSELHHGRLEDILAPTDRAALAPLLARVFAGGAPIEPTRVSILQTGGSWTNVWLALWPIRDDDDDLAFVVASIEPDERLRDTEPRERSIEA